MRGLNGPRPGADRAPVNGAPVNGAPVNGAPAPRTAPRPARGPGRASSPPSVFASVRALAPPVLRALPWRPLAATGLLGPLLAAVPRLSDDPPTPWLAVNLLRGAILLYALGLAFLLDDPARHTTAAVPTGRVLRTGLRLALALPVTVLWWTATLLAMPAEHRPPAGAITLEAAAVCALAAAGAVSALRLGQEAAPGRQVAVGVLLLAVLGPWFLPERWALFVTPDDPLWAAAHDRWAGLLAVSVLTAAVWLREPGARLRIRCGTSGPSRTS
ncbi:ABC transporter [Streptomyces sp. NPDC096080]|uniref:ABC transporter n=1 Tax=Streptomyces sp. NPDC096080 TaxID=3156693 RepID=UPI00331926A6